MSAERLLDETRRWWFGPTGKHADAAADQLITNAMKQAGADRVEREAKAKRDAAWNVLSPAEQAARIEANVLIARASAR